MSSNNTETNAIVTNIIITHSSLDGIKFKESIDLSLVCAAFDQQVNLIFVDKGIGSLIKGQNNSNLQDKNQTDILKGLEFYDIDNIYVEQESLFKSTIPSEQLIPEANIISALDIQRLNISANNLVIL